MGDRHSASAMLVALLVGGCALTLPEHEEEDPVVERQRAQADRLVAAVCGSYYACGCPGEFDVHRDEAECREIVGDEVFHRLKQGRDEGLEYDPTCLDAVASYAEALGCTPGTQVTSDPALRAAQLASDCRTYFGPRLVGEECARLPTADGDDCAPDLRCGDFELCIDYRVLAEGEPCSHELARCEAGTWCVETPLGSTCRRRPALGEACFPGEVCELDALCEPASGTCVALPGPGESCEELGLCRSDATCVDALCVRLPGLGQPCSAAGRCGPDLTCALDQRCEPVPAAVCGLAEALP